jgi:hypothetical protein
MSKFDTEIKLPLPMGEALAACRVAIADLRWKVEGQSATGMVCKEQQASMWGSGTWSAKAEIDARPIGGGTIISVRVSNPGLGPIQSNHVKGLAGAFVNQLQVILDRRASAPPAAPPVMSISDELQRLAALRDSGVLTQEEFEAAKAKLLR